MTWFEYISLLVRDMIGDTDSTNYTYCDTDLQRKILTAINLMQIEIDFDVDYVADIVAETLTPDPTEASPKDNEFMTLAALKTACLIERSEVTKLTSGDVQQITDNGFTIKTGDIGANKLKALGANWCIAYSQAKNNFLSGAGIFGRAVVSPFPAFGDDPGLGYNRRP